MRLPEVPQSVCDIQLKRSAMPQLLGFAAVEVAAASLIIPILAGDEGYVLIRAFPQLE
jgi:hypothetical protein